MYVYLPGFDMDIINWLFYIMKHDDASICSSAVFLITWCSVQSWFPLLCLSSQCLMIVVWLFLTVPRVCLQFVIVVFSVHTHYFQSRTRDWPIWKAIVTSLMSTGLLFADNWVLYIHFMIVLPCKKNFQAQDSGKLIGKWNLMKPDVTLWEWLGGISITTNFILIIHYTTQPLKMFSQ